MLGDPVTVRPWQPHDQTVQPQSAQLVGQAPGRQGAGRDTEEAGQWLGENACELNLTGMLFSEVRYYDFTNQLVWRDATLLLL